MSIESMIDIAGVTVTIVQKAGSTAVDAIGSRVESWSNTLTQATGYVVIRGGYQQSGSSDRVVAMRESRLQTAQIYFSGEVAVTYDDRVSFTHPVTGETIVMEVTSVLHPGMRDDDDSLQYTSVSAAEVLT